MEPSLLRTVMFFVDDPRAAATWWSSQLAGGETLVGDSGYWYFTIDGVEFGFHFSDHEANPVGASPVLFLRVEDIEVARERLVRAGCTVHREPLSVNPSRRLCQMVDPFGNTFGLDGQ